MNDLVASVAVILGALLALLSAIGLLRMSDIFVRLQVATKASSLGVGLLMIGVALHFAEVGITVRAMLVVAFIFLTAPVSAHLIARAAYLTGSKMAPGSEPDELAGAYDAETGKLHGPASAEASDGDEVDHQAASLG